MRIRRGLLFSGLFLIPVGGLTLLARGGYIDADVLRDAWRLWPLVLVGLGLAILLGRTQGAALGSALSGLILGLIVGGALASGSWVGFGVCGSSGDTAEALDRTGSFDGPATVAVDFRCGTVDLATEPGAGWQFHGGYDGPPPLVDATSTRLGLKVPDGEDVKRQDWTVKVAPDLVTEIEFKINAANGTARFDGANLARLAVDSNASDIAVNAAGATTTRLAVTVNAGRLRITLGEGSIVGDVTANAGAVDMCVPPDAGLRIHANDTLTFATNFEAIGLTRTGATWSRPSTGSGGLIDLTIQGNAAAFNLDPKGGCA
jgi:Domain of unknown function (DUF5668)